jgi:hypothetical protein
MMMRMVIDVPVMSNLPAIVFPPLDTLTLCILWFCRFQEFYDICSCYWYHGLSCYGYVASLRCPFVHRAVAFDPPALIVARIIGGYAPGQRHPVIRGNLRSDTRIYDAQK